MDLVPVRIFQQHAHLRGLPLIAILDSFIGGVFRALQGWTSLSHTGPNEGTLKVFPAIKESSAYMMLRPFFR
jgi:hypothetical protein